MVWLPITYTFMTVNFLVINVIDILDSIRLLAFVLPLVLYVIIQAMLEKYRLTLIMGHLWNIFRICIGFFSDSTYSWWIILIMYSLFRIDKKIEMHAVKDGEKKTFFVWLFMMMDDIVRFCFSFLMTTLHKPHALLINVTLHAFVFLHYRLNINRFLRSFRKIIIFASLILSLYIEHFIVRCAKEKIGDVEIVEEKVAEVKPVSSIWTFLGLVSYNISKQNISKPVDDYEDDDDEHQNITAFKNDTKFNQSEFNQTAFNVPFNHTAHTCAIPPVCGWNQNVTWAQYMKEFEEIPDENSAPEEDVISEEDVNTEEDSAPVEGGKPIDNDMLFVVSGYIFVGVFSYMRCK